MPKLDKEKLDQKIAQLEEYIKEIKELGKHPASEFHPKSIIEAAAERKLYRTIQCALDIAQMLVSGLGLGEPRYYAYLFVRLHEAEIISAELKDKLVKMAKMRNVLTHDYARVDPKIIYESICTGMDDLVEFIECIEKKIEKEV